MFIDFKILKIIQRAGGVSDLDGLQMFQEYTGIVMETIAMASVDYFMEKENITISSPEDMQKFMDTLPEKIKTEPELVLKIKDEILEIDKNMVEQFNKTASKGDKAYMEIYLLSKIKEYDKKIAEAKANQDGSTESTLSEAEGLTKGKQEE